MTFAMDPNMSRETNSNNEANWTIVGGNNGREENHPKDAKRRKVEDYTPLQVKNRHNLRKNEEENENNGEREEENAATEKNTTAKNVNNNKKIEPAKVKIALIIIREKSK